MIVSHTPQFETDINNLTKPEGNYMRSIYNHIWYKVKYHLIWTYVNNISITENWSHMNI